MLIAIVYDKTMYCVQKITQECENQRYAVKASFLNLGILLEILGSARKGLRLFTSVYRQSFTVCCDWLCLLVASLITYCWRMIKGNYQVSNLFSFIM